MEPDRERQGPADDVDLALRAPAQAEGLDPVAGRRTMLPWSSGPVGRRVQGQEPVGRGQLEASRTTVQVDLEQEGMADRAINEGDGAPAPAA